MYKLVTFHNLVRVSGLYLVQQNLRKDWRSPSHSEELYGKNLPLKWSYSSKWLFSRGSWVISIKKSELLIEYVYCFICTTFTDFPILDSVPENEGQLLLSDFKGTNPRNVLYVVLSR